MAGITSKTEQDPANEPESAVSLPNDEEDKKDVADDLREDADISREDEEDEADPEHADSPRLVSASASDASESDDASEIDDASESYEEESAAEDDAGEAPQSELPSIDDFVSQGQSSSPGVAAESEQARIPDLGYVNGANSSDTDYSAREIQGISVPEIGRDNSEASREYVAFRGGTVLASRGEGAAEDTRATYAEPVPEFSYSSGEVTDLLDIVKRQWLMIFLIIAGLMSVGGVALSQLEPLYTARAEVVIDPQRVSLPTLESILPSAGTDDQSIETESQILVSGILLERVIEKLDLLDDPEFNLTIDGADSNDTPAARGSGVSTDRALGVTRTALLNRLDVVRVRDSRVISIRATSEDADKAALIANTLVSEFLQARSDARTQASSETAIWLDSRVAELQAVIREAEKQAEELRSEAQILEAGGTTLLSQQMANLNGQIITAKSAAAAARVELSQVLELVEASDSNSILASSGVLNSPIIQELRTQQVALEREIAELSSELGPAHPRMIQLQADASDLENQILIEVDKVVQGLRNAVQVAEARERELQRQASILRARLNATKDDEIQLRAMEREIDANRGLLETLLAQRKELGSPDQSQAGQSGARVISFASTPLTPSFPKTGISMAAIFVVAVLVGLTVAFIREIRRRGLTTLEQLEGLTGVAALGIIPAVKSRSQRRSVLELLSTQPNSPFTQALKTISWQLKELAGATNNTIVVTSSVPEEGKTTLCLGLARMRAKKGYRVLVIDADIRKPDVHEKLRVAQAPGLRDVLEGTCKVEEAIVFDEASSIHVLPAGKHSPDALDVIDSQALVTLLALLGEEYDCIFVDSPPVSVGPDASVLSKHADATVFAVRWSTTPRPGVEFSLRNLRQHGGKMVGALLTMVDLSQASDGYFGYYGYYGEKASQ